MDLTSAVDGYCERLAPGLWSEPVNALTNLAFLCAAWVLWHRVGKDPLACVLVIILAMIGLGSGLFHTFAQAWAAIADTVPILAFILVYVFAINRYACGLGRWAALGMTGLVFPYVAVLVPLIQRVPFLEISAGYWPVPLLITLYAVLLRRRDMALARGLGLGAGLLALSLTFRSLDMLLCPVWPLGTHFLWHLLNAIMLGWMIEVYTRMRRRQAVALCTSITLPSGS